MNVAYVDFSARPKGNEPIVETKKEGFTMIPNDLFEAVMLAGLTQHQLLVFLAVARKTIGYHKESDWISNEQLAALTGLLPHKCSAAKAGMFKRKILLKSGRNICINFDHSSWENGVYLKAVILPKSGNNLLPESGKKNYPNQVNTKERNKLNKKTLKHSSSQLAEASSDNDTKSLPVVHPEAAIQTPAGKQWGTAEDLQAAEWMFSKIQIVVPTSKTPNWPAWANDIRLMRSALDVTHREICKVFKWANADGFWSGNILSPAKLRKQWVTLNAQMARPVSVRRDITECPEPDATIPDGWRG